MISGSTDKASQKALQTRPWIHVTKQVKCIEKHGVLWCLVLQGRIVLVIGMWLLFLLLSVQQMRGRALMGQSIIFNPVFQVRYSNIFITQHNVDILGVILDKCIYCGDI